MALGTSRVLTGPRPKRSGRRITALTAVVILVAMCAACGCALATTRAAGPRLLGTFSTPAVSDGSRFAAWDAGDTTKIIDDAARTQRSLPRPTGCPPSMQMYDGSGGMHGQPLLGGGLLAWSCGDASATFSYWTGPTGVQILDLRTGVVTDATTAFRSAIDSTTEDALPVGVGRHWLAVSVTGYHYTGVSVYVNLNRMALRTDDRTPVERIDLDSASLVRRMCAPLRLSPVPGALDDPYGVTDPFEPFQYEHPFGLTIVGRKRDELLLERCGTRPRVLRACPVGDSPSFQLGAGAVTCTNEDLITVIDAANGRSRRWRFRGYDGLLVAHTRRRILVSVPVKSGWRVFTIPLPNLHGGSPRT